ncbi:MAG TPA: CHAT domain-containing protein [Nannocystis exedens]|nr:CHAT domain-containing protein [Nannocystis exedens]
MLNATSETRVLYISATPAEMGPIDHQAEYEELHEELTERGDLREQFSVTRCQSATRQDLVEAIWDVDPHIIHIACHGKTDSLVLQGDAGFADRMDKESLEVLLAGADHLKLVILSACNSADLARSLSESRNIATIGVAEMLDSADAREFSESFYSLLARGESIEQAFNIGVHAIPNTVPFKSLFQRFGPGSYRVRPPLWPQLASPLLLISRLLLAATILFFALTRIEHDLNSECRLPDSAISQGSDRSPQRSPKRNDSQQLTLRGNLPRAQHL